MKKQLPDASPASQTDTSPSLGRSDWIAAARRRFISLGIEAVKVAPLAVDLGATTGSFYWHFKSRKELYDALVNDWVQSNGMPFAAAVQAAGPDPRKRYLAFIGVYLFEKGFSPDYDSAVRAWARLSREVFEIAERVDNDRIQLLKEIFLALGFDDTQAFIRARITHFHQVGYYNMEIRETRSQRLQLVSYYAEALTGDSWFRTMPPDELASALGGAHP